MNDARFCLLTTTNNNLNAAISLGATNNNLNYSLEYSTTNISVLPQQKPFLTEIKVNGFYFLHFSNSDFFICNLCCKILSSLQNKALKYYCAE